MNVKWYVSDTPEKKVYNNKEIEKHFEERFGIPISYHEEDIGGGKKRGVLTPIKKNMEILTNLEKALGSGQPVNFQIENSKGELVKVSKEEFAKWMVNEKNVKTPSKESLVYGASGDIDGTTVFVEIKDKDGVIKESYYESRNEEEKKQIIERNQKRREQENSQAETSPNSDKKDQKSEKDKLAANQQSSLQDKNIYYGVGVISLVLLVISMVVVWVKKKK